MASASVPVPADAAGGGDESLQEQILRLGESLWRRTRGQAPSLFNPRYWHGVLLEWAMRDPVFKTDLFRFVDVLPALRDADDVAAHIKAYFLRDGRDLPSPIALAMRAASGKWTAGLGAWAIRRNVTEMAQRFITGENVEDAIGALKGLRFEGIGFTADLLGEATLSEDEADAVQGRYLELIERLADETARWPANPLLDQDHLGPIPRANVSIKLSALDPNLDPADPAGGVARLLARALPIFLRARERGVFINVDMEQWTLHDIVYDLFEAVATHPQLRDWPHMGAVVQAYLRTAGRDVDRLLELARRRGAPLTIRLVKGAYWDAEVVRARQFGYPCPVFLEKAQADAQYEELSLALLENIERLRSAFASHNLRSLAHAMVQATRLGLPDNAYEIQMLYGMAEPERAALRQMGRRVRAYTPIGALLPGMAYLVRRLLENTANSSFLRMNYHERVNIRKLLAPPSPKTPLDAPGALEPAPISSITPTTEIEVVHPLGKNPQSAICNPQLAAAGEAGEDARAPGNGPHFENCPLLDFTDPARRKEFASAIGRFSFSLPIVAPVVVAGRERTGRQTMTRLCPSDNRHKTAVVSLATAADADDAVGSAMAAWPAWRERPLEDRARILERLAGLIERERVELAALECWEVAKPWREADADIAEAIDFCRYYARQALEELAPRPLGDVPGEKNSFYLEGRGPTAVIAPWNFPLAILCGMSVAALVAGNPVLLKPAEQSSAIAYRFFRLALQAGVPPEILHFLPGIGEVVGRRLVEHPWVAQIAFTGSRAVGLQIIERAAKTVPGQPQVKRVVCEMGGKNAIVIDEDADLDEAVAGVIKSAFDYAGQKCSACSRVITVGEVSEPFAARLVEAVRSLPVGPATEPATRLGPVVDEEAWRRLMGVISDPGPGATLVYCGEAPEGGWFVPPAIFAVREPRHRMMQEEFFGPVLALHRAASFEEALSVACATEYALTGGVFSRNPERLELARRRFRTGNLYLNRAITGAMVGRQPFGGFAMSGVGAKAGGPGYLSQFAQPRCITDNTTRHGFTPEVTV